MLKVNAFIVTLLTFVLLASCFRGPDKNREVLARVHNTYLYKDEIDGLIPSGQNKNDSIELLKVYIQKWVEQQLILADAGKILSSVEKDFSKKIREYRNALLVFEWEKKILALELDTVVTEQQLKSYYESNAHEFILQRDIVRVLYIKLNANSLKFAEAGQLIRQEPFSRSKTEQFCSHYAVNYFLDDKSWLYVEDIQKEIPLNAQQRQEMSTGNVFIEMKDEEYMYILKVLEIKLKGSVSPLALEEQTIRNIIIQKRKIDITDNYIANLRNNAEKKSSVEIFLK